MGISYEAKVGLTQRLPRRSTSISSALCIVYLKWLSLLVQTRVVPSERVHTAILFSCDHIYPSIVFGRRFRASEFSVVVNIRYLKPTMEQEDAEQKKPTANQDVPLDDGLQPKADAGDVSKKPNLPKRLWTASGLNVITLKLMFKGAIAPTIALAIYQAHSIAKIYSTLGYLVAIMSILSMPIMPRSKSVLQ